MAWRCACGERPDVGELVDEDAVALVGGDAAGGGVRGRDELLLLEERHVVADRRGGDAEAWRSTIVFEPTGSRDAT